MAPQTVARESGQTDKKRARPITGPYEPIRPPPPPPPPERRNLGFHYERDAVAITELIKP